MVWDINGRQGNESAKIRWELVPYTRGRGIDVGCGPYKAFDHFIGLDNGHHQVFGHSIKPDVKIETAEKLEFFANSSLDFVFSSHLLEHIPPGEPCIVTLKEWWRTLKIGGYLCLYVPADDLYPKVGEHGANPDHKWNVNYDAILELMEKVGNWDMVEYQKRDQDDEYSLFFVFKKVGKGLHFSWRNEKPKKTVAVVRYGAFGDLLQASSVFAGLKAQGHHVTLYTSPPGHEVIIKDPNVDQIILQDKDQVPNHELGNFWAYIAKKYDKFINLSESVEGSLLAMPGRTLHAWPPKLRHELLDHNYLEVQHKLAEVPHEPQVKFYTSLEEREWAEKEARKMTKDGPIIVWSLAGSSVHKTWPYLDEVVAKIMLDFKDAHIVMVGGPESALLEAGWENEPRVHMRCGKWTIRETMSFLDQADLVIGPETGVLNAAANMQVPKVVFLSHSTPQNLTRDWVSTVSLVSRNTTCPGRGNNEVTACHQLHYGWTHCKRGEKTGVAQCQEDIPGTTAYEPIKHYIKEFYKRKAAT